MQATNRVLSCLQPYAYAQQIGPGEDWLIEEKDALLPFDSRNDRYKAMLYKERRQP